MAVRYYGGSAPQGQAPAPVRVLRLKPEERATVRCLSAAIGGVLTHFVGKRSLLCQGEECAAPIHKQNPTWKGYVAAERYERAHSLWIPCVLEITESAELDMRGRYARGQVWELDRCAERKSKGCPCRATLLKEADLAGLREPFDVRLVLVHLYHAQAIHLDAPNPLPPRLYLPPSEGKI